MTHHKSFGLVLKTSNEVCRNIFIILEDIVVFLDNFLYDSFAGIINNAR